MRSIQHVQPQFIKNLQFQPDNILGIGQRLYFAALDSTLTSIRETTEMGVWMSRVSRSFPQFPVISLCFMQGCPEFPVVVCSLLQFPVVSRSFHLWALGVSRSFPQIPVWVLRLTVVFRGFLYSLSGYCPQMLLWASFNKSLSKEILLSPLKVSYCKDFLLKTQFLSCFQTFCKNEINMRLGGFSQPKNHSLCHSYFCFTFNATWNPSKC